MDSNDSNDLSDTTSLDDGSENIDMPTESKQSKNRVSDVKDEIPYREIVYDDHNRTYTKRFEEEDEQVRLRSESEKSGKVTVRPLRLTPIGRKQELTEFDKKFLKYA